MPSTTTEKQIRDGEDRSPNLRQLRVMLEYLSRLFEQDLGDSFSRVIEEFRAGDNVAECTLPEDLESCAWGVADLCPVQIISISD